MERHVTIDSLPLFIYFFTLIHLEKWRFLIRSSCREFGSEMASSDSMPSPDISPHTARRYVPCGVLRLTKAQLDGACSDVRFDEEFFIDLIFAPVEKALSKTAAGGGGVGVGGGPSSAPSDSGLLIDISSSDSYEQSLHRDTRFWDAVSARKTKSKKRRSRKYLSNTNDQFIITDEGSSSPHDDEMDSIRFSAGTADRSAGAISSSSG